MADLIAQMRAGSKILQTEAEDIQKWSKLKHNKSDLELFLAFNIAELKFKTVDGADAYGIFTGNMPLVEVMQAAKAADKKKIVKKKAAAIRTKDPFSVDAWDLVDNKRKTVSLRSWQIVNFLTISPENILVLDEVIKQILKQ